MVVDVIVVVVFAVLVGAVETPDVIVCVDTVWLWVMVSTTVDVTVTIIVAEAVALR